MTRPGFLAWRVVVSMFTIIPVAGSARVDRAEAARALLLLPVLGALLGGVGAGVLVAGEAAGDSLPRRLLAALLAVATLAVLTGGLHLDGLADAADGLASRRSGQQALAIMRQPDVGPIGVAALLFVVLAQVIALTVITPGWQASLALIVAASTGRVAVVLAAAEPAARPDGFGALVAGGTRARARVCAVAVLLAAVVATGAAAVGLTFAGRCAGAVLAGLVVGAVLQRTARHRLGGITGDVFGAIIEVCEATVLVALALSGAGS